VSDAVPESREAALRYWAGDDRNFVDNPACHAKTNECVRGDTWLPTTPPAFSGRIRPTRNPLLSVRMNLSVRGLRSSGISFALAEKCGEVRRTSHPMSVLARPTFRTGLNRNGGLDGRRAFVGSIVRCLLWLPCMRGDLDKVTGSLGQGKLITFRGLTTSASRGGQP
jgi:hypothetical protein